MSRSRGDSAKRSVKRESRYDARRYAERVEKADEEFYSTFDDWSPWESDDISPLSLDIP